MKRKLLLTTLMGALMAPAVAEERARPRGDAQVRRPAPSNPAERPVASSSPAPESTLALPEAPPPDMVPKPLTEPAPKRRPALLPVLEGVRALATAEGEARLIVDGVEQVVRPGSAMGNAVVKSVAPGRLVLARPDPDGKTGETLVIVTFDAKGEGRTRTLWSRDPRSSLPPEVR